MFFQAIHPKFFQWNKSQQIPPGIHSKTKVGGLDLFETLEHMRKIPVWTPRKERSVLGVFGDLGDRSSKGRSFLSQETWQRFCGFFCQVDWWVSFWYLAWPKDSSTNDDSMGKCLNPRLVSIVMSFSLSITYGKKPHAFSSVCFIHVQISFFLLL